MLRTCAHRFTRLCQLVTEGADTASKRDGVNNVLDTQYHVKVTEARCTGGHEYTVPQHGTQPIQVSGLQELATALSNMTSEQVCVRCV
jgi:hypothetical protein